MEKVSHEDAARSKTDAELAAAVEWADEIEARDKDGRTAFVRMLADAPGTDYSFRDNWTQGAIAAIRAEAARRAAGGTQDLEALAKMQRVLSRAGLSAA